MTPLSQHSRNNRGESSLAAAVSALESRLQSAAVDHARARYAHHANLRFRHGDCTALDLADASVDLVVSFETIEHVAAQEALVAGFARVLAPDGVLIMSSPDKRTYHDVAGFRNEFHVRELYRDELLALLNPHFPFVYLYGQKLLFQSAIWSLQETPNGAVAAATQTGTSVQPGLDYDPLYFIALCSRRPIERLPQLALFGDREESVYQHYNLEVRKNMAAGARIVELEAEIAKLRRDVEESRARRRE